MADKILVVDDERSLVKALTFALEKEGFKTEAAYDGEEALAKWHQDVFDLVILDLMMPGLDGYEVCRRLREITSVPIIMLTARSEDINKIQGLELGADDYITKPFNPRELIARIKAVLRRFRNNANQGVIRIRDLAIDVLRHRAIIRGKNIDLTAKEFALLSLLVQNPGTVFSREKLLQQIWGYEYFGDPRTVDVHIRHLREKIEEDSSQPQYIVTVWGAGYKLREEE